MRLQLKSILYGVLFVSLLSIGAGLIYFFTKTKWKIRYMNNNVTQQVPYKVSTPYEKSSEHLDPHKISVLSEYELLRNLYSQLVMYDQNGQLVTGVPESFQWQNDSLEFQFGNRVTTVDGQVITAEDAAISLKRAIYIQKTGHGDLRNFLCPEHSLKSVLDECPGITVQGNRLILTPAKPEYASFLLPFLTSVDFSILPKQSLDLNSPDIKIISKRNTSGPYYVEKDAQDGSWVLKANPHHFSYSKEMPQVVQLVPMELKEIVNAFIESKIDLIPTFDLLPAEGINFLLASNKKDRDYNINESIPIQTTMLAFTPKAVRDFTAEQRFYVADIISRQYLQKTTKTTASQKTVEFFQALSDGSLDGGQIKEIETLRVPKNKPVFKRPMQIPVSPHSYDRMKMALAGYPEIEVVKVKTYPFQLPIEEKLDVYFCTNDSAWGEDVTLLGYNFGMSIFHLPGVDGTQWVKSYIKIADKPKRMEMLRDLHYKMLKEAVIYPVYASPYFAFVKKPWVPHFSTLSTGTELWRMRQEQ